MNPEDILQLTEWRRRIFGLYRDIRTAAEPEKAWLRWRSERADLFRNHAQSPVPAAERASYDGPHCFDYDPSARVLGSVEAAVEQRLRIPASGEGGDMELIRFATTRFELSGEPCSLDLFWFDNYGGGLFLSFRDKTSGTETYGACRYLLDTVKGADLGVEGGKIVLDFNFSYQPSCSYDPRWVCPLAPVSNRLSVAVRAGERLRKL